MEFLEYLKVALALLIVVVAYFLSEIYDKRGVNSVLAVGAWVSLCVCLHLFQGVPGSAISMILLMPVLYGLASFVLLRFLDKHLDRSKEGVKYCMLSVMTLFLALLMKLVASPWFWFFKIGLLSFVFVFLITGVILLIGGSKAKTTRIHGDIVAISSLIFNLYFLQVTGGLLMIFSDFNLEICIFLLILGILGSVSMYVNKQTLQSLGWSVLLGLSLATISDFLITL